jgi:DTW domain-containing protein
MQRCLKCLLPQKSCVCTEIEPIELGINITIIRHWKETLRASNTARLVQHSISDVTMLDFGYDHEILDDFVVSQEDDVVLFPPSEGIPILSPSTNVKRLIVPDGTWKQVRKILGRYPQIRSLPRVHISPFPVPFPRLRNPTVPNGMSTVEAVARVLGLMGMHVAEERLRVENNRLMDALRKTTGIKHPLVPGLCFQDLRQLDNKK